jgi:hypothetical protein
VVGITACLERERERGGGSPVTRDVIIIIIIIIDTIRWLVISTGRYVNKCGYRLLTGTNNI